MPSKDEIESRVHDLSNGLLQFDEKKIKLVLRMTKESTITLNSFPIKSDHELPRTPGIGHVALYFALSSTLESKEIPYFAPEVFLI